jgi:1,4-dihydroxy-2-naphthoate octaprenyltransferase
LCPWKFFWFCWLAPGLGFGPLMVMGTEVALAGQYTLEGFVASLVPFFLVNNLLLLNQYPDIEADKAVGRRHFLVVYGREYGT